MFKVNNKKTRKMSFWCLCCYLWTYFTPSSIVSNKKKLYDTFFWMGFNCLNATGSLQGDSLLLTSKSPGSPGTHLIEKMDGRLSWLWSHTMVLNLGRLEWESSALTTRPFHFCANIVVLVSLLLILNIFHT